MKPATALRLLLFVILSISLVFGAQLKLNNKDYFEAQGISVLLHQNAFHGVFFDQKLAGLEIILHGERIATDGDVRLLPTPEQWDPVPHFKDRKRGPNGSLIAYCAYPDQHLSYNIEVTPEVDGFRVVVNLDQPLPAALQGKAGFNLEFVPTSSISGKSVHSGHRHRCFPPASKWAIETR